MYIQGVENVYDLKFNKEGVRYGEVFLRSEKENSAFNFEYANTELLLNHFTNYENECLHLLSRKITLPAYDHCIKASHLFNLLDARGVISVTERAAYISRIRNLAKSCCLQWVESENLDEKSLKNA